MRDPDIIAQASFRLLRPGGAFATVTHDYRSPVNRMLGKRSPIFDIEHMQLFSRRAVRFLWENRPVFWRYSETFRKHLFAALLAPTCSVACTKRWPRLLGQYSLFLK